MSAAEHAARDATASAPASPTTHARLDALDRAILNRLQAGIAVVERPFAAIAEELGTDEDTVIERLSRALDAGVLSRFGPMIDVERMGGVFTLCALEVPESRLEAVAKAVNAHPEVAHNYRRAHRLNMWFVLATESEGATARAVEAIERETGLEILALPKEREYFVGLRLAV